MIISAAPAAWRPRPLSGWIDLRNGVGSKLRRQSWEQIGCQLSSLFLLYIFNLNTYKNDRRHL